MSGSFDAIIIGAGIIGAATALALARAGRKVLAVEKLPASVDSIFGRIRARGLAHWADPFKQRPSEINRNDGGRGVYFEDPDSHLLEVLTRPYGSGSSA